MTALLFLIPAALCLGGAGLAAFMWALKSGQYEDLEGAALRVLDDADIAPAEAERRQVTFSTAQLRSKAAQWLSRLQP